jgi:hypothetical protein
VVPQDIKLTNATFKPVEIQPDGVISRIKDAISLPIALKRVSAVGGDIVRNCRFYIAGRILAIAYRRPQYPARWITNTIPLYDLSKMVMARICIDFGMRGVRPYQLEGSEVHHFGPVITNREIHRAVKCTIA